MKIQVYSNGNYINISFFKIDLMKVYQLFEYMNIDYVSILLDESNEYILKKYILIGERKDEVNLLIPSV